MKAIRVFNNNAVSAVMLDGRVAIVLGKGIGFHKRPGDPVEERCIEKVYYVQDEMQTKFLQMLQNAEPSVMRAAEQILAMAENAGFSMSNQATISLIDHIGFAIERQKKNIDLPNLLLNETQLLYQKEYDLGRRSLKIIQDCCGVTLPEDEAGYIALHLVTISVDHNAAYGSLKFIKDYWILNYSNPAAIVSEACRVLRPKARIINICDMPIAIIDVVAAAMEIKDKENIVYDYFGLNHFGWFTSIEYKGEDLMPRLRAYIKEHEILMPAAYLKDKAALGVSSGTEGNRHTKGSWYYVWKGVYEIMENFPEYLPNTYLNYYLQQKEFVEHSNPEHTRANEVMETREKNLFDGVDAYLATGKIDEKVFYAGSHGDWIADLAIALKNDTKARFLVITENRGAIPNMPYDAMVELPAYIGKNGPEVIARDPIPLFQQGLMMQQVNSEKLLVEGCIEGSYEKVLQAFTLNKTVPSMNVAKEILDEMIEANKGYWPELK